MFAQYIFSRISRRASDARKFDVSENYNQNRTNRNKEHMRENLTARMCLIGLRENIYVYSIQNYGHKGHSASIRKRELQILRSG